MVEYIKELIKQGENQRLDFKYEVSDSKKIARSMVAFANCDGGRLLIGVKDNGNIKGVLSDEEYYMIEAASDLYCKPKVEFEAKTWKVEGKTVLEIIVGKSEGRPHYAPDQNNKWTAYIRSADQNRLANSVLLKLWEREKKPQGTYLRYTEKEKQLLNYLKNNPPISLSGVRKLTYLSKYKAELVLVNLLAIKVVKVEFYEDGIRYALVKKE